MRLRALALLAAVTAAAPAQAHHVASEERTDFDPALLRIDEGQYLGQQVPDVEVVTESGTARLHDLVADQPTILLLAYYTCYDVCRTTIQNLASVLEDVDGPEHRVIVASFDAEDNLENLRNVKSTLGPLPDSWTFGLLPGEEAARLTQSVGFKFFFSEHDQAFIHPGVLVFLSPDAEVMRYLYGAEPRVQDIELALIESRNAVQRLSDIVDVVRLTCFRYDASRSRYVVHPTLIFGGLGIGVLGMTGLLAFSYRAKS